MADSIDRLNIEITSSTEKAQRAISGLITKLQSLSGALQGVSGGTVMSGVTSSVESANKAIGQVAKNSERLKKSFAGYKVTVNTAQAEKAISGLEKTSKNIAPVVKPKMDVSELETLKKRLLTEKWIPQDLRQSLMDRANAPVAPGAEDPAKTLSLRAQMLTDILDEQKKIVTQTEEEKAAREAANQRIQETADAYRQAARAMKEAMPDTAYRPSFAGGYVHGNGEFGGIERYRVEDFLPGGSRSGGSGESTASQELDQTANSADNAASSVEHLRVATSSMSGVFERIRGIAGNAFSKVGEGVANANYHIAQLAVKLGEITFRGITAGAKMAGSAIAKAFSQINGFSLGVFQGLMEGVDAATKRFAGSLATLAGRLAALPFKPLTKTLSGFGGHLSGVSKSVNSASHSFRDGLKFVMRYVFGFRSLFYMARYVRTAIKDAFGNLAHTNDATNQNLSLLASRLDQVKNSLATAFDPILTVVTPILDTFLQYIIAGLNALGQFFAVLTGQSTWQKANLQMKDYAAGLDKTKSGAQGAKDAADELKKSLMGFDKINKLDDPNSSGSGSGSGGGAGGADYGGMFTTETVSTGISDFAKMVKDAWEKADFTEVGEIIGRKLADALNSIPWEKVKEQAGRLGKSFATLINGLVSVKELATALGTTIGETINTIFTAANSFVSNLNFGAIGEFIADALNKGIQTVDFGLVADTLAKFANGKFNLMATWAGKFDFGALGTAIKNVVVDTIEGLDWSAAKEAAGNIGKGLAKALNQVITFKSFSSVATLISESLNTVVEGASNFVDNVHWELYGTAIANAINTFFETFDLTKAGVTLVGFVNGLIKVVEKAVTNTDWKTVGSKIATAIQKMLEKFDWAGTLGTALSIGTAVLNTITGAIESIDWKDIPQKVADGIANIFTENEDKFDSWLEAAGELVGTALAAGIDLLGAIGKKFANIAKDIADYFKKKIDEAGYDEDKGLLECGEAIITGIFNGIIDFLGNVGQWISDHILDPFVKGFKKKFGISDSAAKDEEVTGLGGSVIEGVFSGIVDFLKNVGKWIKENIFDKFVKGFKEKFGISDGEAKDKEVSDLGKSTIEGIFGGIIEWMKNIGKWLKENVFDKIVEKWNEFWKNPSGSSDSNGNIIDVGINLVKNGWKTISGFVGDKVETAISLVKKGWTTISDFVGKVADVAVSLVQKAGEWSSEAWEVLKKGGSTAITTVQTALKQAKDWASVAWSAIQAGGKSLTTTVSTALKQAKDWAGVAWSAIQAGGKAFTTTVSTALKQAKDWAGVAWSAIQAGGKSLTTTVSTALKQAKDWAGVAWSAIQAGGKTFATTVNTALKQAKDWAGVAWSAIQAGGKSFTTTVSTALKQAKDWVGVAWSAIQAGGKSFTTTVSTALKQAKDWTGVAWSVIQAGGKSFVTTVSTALKQAKDWAGVAWSVIQAGGKSFVATVSTALKQAKDWASVAWSALQAGGKSFKTTVSTVLKKAKDWAGVAWSAIQAGGKSFKTTVSTVLKKAKDWVGVAWAAIQAGGKSFKTTVSTVLKQAKDWAGVAWAAIQAGGKSFTTTVSTALKQAKDWAGVAWAALQAGGKSFTSTVSTAMKKASDWSSDAWDAISNAGKTFASAVVVSLQKKWNLIQSWFNYEYGDGGTPSVTVSVNYHDSGFSGTSGKFAKGGAFFNGVWHKIPQYAGGAVPTHGSLFVAGEAGAEVVGHLGGRTEVLNQSQLASVMYDAVVRGMMQALSVTGNNTEVHVHLDGDAGKLFRMVQREANNYTNATGQPAFNL